MSERFALAANQTEIEDYFSVQTDAGFNITPDYNISIGAIHPLVLFTNGQLQIKRSKWGLIPPGANDERAGREHGIIPVEDIQETPWHAECLEKRRALVPASGFYKWKTTENKSTPFYVRMLATEIMAMAGIYSRWKSEGGLTIFSFAVLTQKASPLIEPVDNRMPLTVPKSNFKTWLDEEKDAASALEQVQGSSSGLTEMIVNRVSEEVNDITNKGAELIQPIPK